MLEYKNKCTIDCHSEKSKQSMNCRILRLLLILQMLAINALANTESFLLDVPKNFPLNKGEGKGHLPLYISLANTNLAKKTIQTKIAQEGYLTYVELKGLQNDETYQVKICWSALDPISIEDMKWFIVPHSTEFERTVSEDARIFIQFSIKNDSYPVMKLGTNVPINVSIINTKLGVPVDLYKILIYITTLMIGVGFLNNKINFYGLLKA